MTIHKSVLLKETIGGLDIKPGDVVVDATLGGGGHSAEICSLYGNKVKIIGLDADAGAIAKAQERLGGMDCDFKAVLSNFRDLEKVLQNLEISAVDKILADLGLSTFQLEEFGRGFSFQKDEPLLMTFKSNPEEEDITALDIVNNWKAENIAQILWGYGEERYGRKIANAISEARDQRRIETTTELVEIIRNAVPKSYLRQKTHFATRTFQALRIATNDELRTLSGFLEKSYQYLKPGGRIAIITFHSLEDRIVKRFFKEKEKEQRGKLINKKPIGPSDEELRENKRARSAKLRIIEKIK
jgi:16S rRNA (cytosine1402-N4)-methyltransferase